ncbi:MAG TPA: outer membrane beta-barrel protein [Steroidobacteraceae bacterium]|jgi:hypothetical protein|nr:outer membrane beta-barrel protein [Steroidobacteraceae bacterium]
MHSKIRISLAAATTSLALLSAVGAAWADSAPAAPAKPPIPSLADTLAAWGLTETGYVDATFGYSHIDESLPAGVPTDYNSFALNQAGLTVAMQPSTGFGGLVNVVEGSSPYAAIGDGLLNGKTNTLFQSSPQLYLMQAFAQYLTGPWTVEAGKFATLAGAEVFAPNGNTNVTRSILFNFEPVTHTGVRATYAVNGMLNLIFGVNNGWTLSQDISDGSDKTFEAGLAFTPNKVVSWTLQGYYGRDNLNWSPTGGTTKGNLLLLDTVVTWTATSALTVIGTVDYGNVGNTSTAGAGVTATSPSASWWGAAGYLNYAINPEWRVSLRGEYFDDTDGYETGLWSTNVNVDGDTSVLTMDEKLAEATLTFGYDPIKNFEARIEGRYDFPSPSYSTTETANYQVKAFQGWLEALYHF